MIGRGSQTTHFDLKYQGMEQTYFISKFLLWNMSCGTVTPTCLQTGNLYAKKMYWQLSEQSRRKGVLSKGRRAGSCGWQHARQGSTLIGKGTDSGYLQKLSRVSLRMVIKFIRRPMISREIHSGEAGLKSARKARCSKTHGQAQAELHHCSGRSQWWEPELKSITQVKGTSAYQGFWNLSCSDSSLTQGHTDAISHLVWGPDSQNIRMQKRVFTALTSTVKNKVVQLYSPLSLF